MFYGNLGLSNIILDMYEVERAYTQLKNGLRVETYHDVSGEWVIKAIRNKQEVTNIDIMKINHQFSVVNIALPQPIERKPNEVTWIIEPIFI